MFRYSLLLMLWLLMAGALSAASTSESKAFRAASAAFVDGNYPVAERWFAKFLVDFPKSERRAEAVLLQAQARFRMKNYSGTVDLLGKNIASAGSLDDRYRFWQAEAHLYQGEFEQAAGSYSALVSAHPSSTRILDALYGEVEARLKLGQTEKVITLLRDPQGAFQKASATQTNHLSALRGFLLLAEILFKKEDLAGTKEVLSRLSPQSLPPELFWQREQISGNVHLREGRLDEALQATTNLLALPLVQSHPLRRSETMALQGKILEKKNQPLAAIEVYQKNLTADVPEDRRNAALMRIVNLNLKQNKIAEANTQLEAFLQQFPTNAFAAEVLLTLGELKLKEFFLTPPTNGVFATNGVLIREALTNFDRLISEFPQTHLLPKAQLGRGWCLWLQEDWDQARAAFQEAANRLGLSQEKAIAHFKLGDAEFKLQHYGSAYTNYQRVLQDFSEFSQVQTSLVEEALYQMIRSAIAGANLEQADGALQLILSRFPDGSVAEPGLLLYGQAAAHQRSPKEARQIFEDFIKRFPGAKLLPDVHAALARSYVEENDWEAAAQRYDSWLKNFADHHSASTNEYMRAWVYYMGGSNTNVLALLTNFIARFPTNYYTPYAQLMAGNYYWNKMELDDAQLTYQKLFENPLAPKELAYQAQLAGSDVASAAGRFSRAREILTALVNNLVKETNTSSALLGEALLKLGDTRLSEFLQDTTERSMENFNQALEAFVRITRDFPTNALSARAWGRIGDCYFQLAGIETAEPQHYDKATNAYWKALSLPQADVTIRSIAEMGLGNVHTRRGQREEALNHYFNIVYENEHMILKDGERFDPLWNKEAGLAAAKILETQEEWEAALNLYQRLIDKLPALRAGLEKKMESARKNVRKI